MSLVPYTTGTMFNSILGTRHYSFIGRSSKMGGEVLVTSRYFLCVKLGKDSLILHMEMGLNIGPLGTVQQGLTSYILSQPEQAYY